ncbi:MAG: glutamate--tRNA ligase, partial [bacterium]|nr:glutamate--tRNA ligase [bacterium]
YQQSQRGDLYKKYLDQLVKEGRVYPCFATHEEIELDRRRSLATGKAFVFRGKERDLSEGEIKEFMDQGKPFHYRFKVDREIIKFHDVVYGEKVFDTVSIGDFSVARSDGSPLYLFASAVDDVLMEISHVIRGEDGMSNTPRQILIQKALGFEPPQYAHLPLILGEDHTLLSKRNGSCSLGELKAKGYLPEAILNYLSLLGWSPPEGKELLNLDQLVQAFSLERVSRSSAIFDWNKLNFINNHYLRQLSEDDYLSWALPIVEQGQEKFASFSTEDIRQAILTLRPNIKRLEELPDWLELILGTPEPVNDEAKAFMEAKESPKVWESVVQLIKDMTAEFNEENAKLFLEELKKKSKIKGRKLLMPIRVALTGATEGPEMANLLICLGKTRIGERIQRAIENLQHSQ